MDRKFTVGTLIERLMPLAPAGFAVALHIRYSSSRYLFQGYPQSWRDQYSAEGLVMDDPTVAWGFANSGAIRWSELAAGADRKGLRVFEAARRHGLRFGVSVAIPNNDGRSIASAARGDREYTDAEIAEFSKIVEALHEATGADHVLSDEDHAVLRRLSIHLTK